ncbi:response regulator [Halomicroarcula sp. F13]|uniref:histidine kinase n=1 Tax=Haloarcula rubra TaxID=2487747 RepID=A0AAW4PT06_9EURY|nr:ATP-binding protein [Halomicroarcula rubra]MBX0323814.1 response regulator [Halomicroarcula rubra]
MHDAVAGAEPSGHDHHGTMRVVYVDPDADAVTAVRTALSAADETVDVVSSESVAEAVDLVGEHPIDCLVTEYTLPDGTGLDLLRSVRERHPDLPVVLFIDDGSEAIASDALAAGATDYVLKAPLEEQAAVLADRVRAATTEQADREAILGRMTDAFLALDEEWRFTYLNDRGREILREAAGADEVSSGLVGRRIWDVVPEAVDTAFYDLYHRAMETQEPETLEAYYEPLETWFDVRAFPSDSGLSVYFRDVTARREREDSLAEREAVLTEMYRVIAEKETPFEEKVDHLLDVGREALGTEFGALSRVEGSDYVFEAVRDPTGQTQPGDVIPLASTNCERAIVERETLVLEDIAADSPELTDRAGFTEMGIACYVGMPVVVDGEVYGTFCFYDRDPRREAFADWEVTLVELMGNWISYELERERRERDLTRERNRLDDFASVVSHDLRNPLNVATGHLELLLEEYDGDPDHVVGMQRALTRMDALIDDLLTLARSGTQVVETSTVELETLCRQAWAVVESEHATLTVTDQSATVSGDESRLQQLFENLFRNCVEHGSTDGQDDGVDVRVGVLSNGDGLYVADDGPGIPEDEREKVFESGYTTSDGGTGFGLRIVAEIAEAHGARVTIAESEGGGARFEIHGLTVG